MARQRRSRRSQCPASSPWRIACAVLVAAATAPCVSAKMLTLSDFQPIYSDTVSVSCVLAYNDLITGCEPGDFRRGRACSDHCVSSLSHVEAEIQDACADVEAPSGSVMAKTLGGDLVDFLCPNNGGDDGGQNMTPRQSGFSTIRPLSRPQVRPSSREPSTVASPTGRPTGKWGDDDNTNTDTNTNTNTNTNTTTRPSTQPVAPATSQTPQTTLPISVVASQTRIAAPTTPPSDDEDNGEEGDNDKGGQNDAPNHESGGGSVLDLDVPAEALGPIGTTAGSIALSVAVVAGLVLAGW